MSGERDDDCRAGSHRAQRADGDAAPAPSSDIANPRRRYAGGPLPDIQRVGQDDVGGALRHIVGDDDGIGERLARVHDDRGCSLGDDQIEQERRRELGRVATFVCGSSGQVRAGG